MADIAIIDDSQATLDMLATILRRDNHQVRTYQSSLAVEKSLAVTRPNLILLDVVMPERNGYEVLRSLQRNEATKDIPVILVSSKAEETDIRWGKRQGAAAYVTKPFTSEHLLETVNSYL